MDTQLSDRIEQLQDAVSDLHPTIHDSDDESATLSVALNADSFEPLVRALQAAELRLVTLTYRGVNGQSTITVRTRGQTTTKNDIDVVEERVTDATPRGAVDDDTYAFTVFGSNNRVEAHDIFTTAYNCGYRVTQISATTSPPLCVDVHITPQR